MGRKSSAADGWIGLSNPAASERTERASLMGLLKRLRGLESLLVLNWTGYGEAHSAECG